MSDVEIRLARMWYNEDGKAPSEIAKLLRRYKSTITRHVVKEVEKQKQGRPPALTEEQKKLLVPKLEQMIKKAKGEWRVSRDRRDAP